MTEEKAIRAFFEKKGKNIRINMQKGTQSCIMELPIKSKHEKEVPQCGISNWKTAKLYKERIPNPAKNQGVNGSSEKANDPTRSCGNGSIHIFNVAIRKFSYDIFSAGKYGKTTETRHKRTNSEGRRSKGCIDKDRCGGSAAHP